MKNILGKLAILLLSLFTSWGLFYFIISEVITRFMSSSVTLSLIIMLSIAVVFYIAAVSIVYKKFNWFYIDVIAGLYFLLVIGLTFFKSSYSSAFANINPLSIIHEFRTYFNHTILLLISNILIYIPLGTYISYKTRISVSRLFLGFIFYILVIEFIQAFSHRGIFDINDIITNTLGFLTGILCNNLAKHYYKKHNDNYSY
jgi:glycopeptide antibiotics resistance protein